MSYSKLRTYVYTHFKDTYCLDPKLCTILEGQIYQVSLQMNHLGTPKGPRLWGYSNGTTLFDTDRPESHAREFISSYLTNLEHVKELLKDKTWRDQILKDPYQIFSQESYGMPYQSEGYTQWKDEYEKHIKDSKTILEQKNTLESTEGLPTFIKCKKCKGTLVDTEQKQTRSADEPMTIFCICRTCGNRFVMT